MTRKIHVRSVSIWVVKEWYIWPFAWLFAGRKYIHNLYDFLIKVRDPAFEKDLIFDRLNILSHGNCRRDADTGQVVGHYINMGGEDKLDTSDFDQHMHPLFRAKTDLFIRILGEMMAERSRLVFSACGQGDGTLLRNISYCLGKDIVVSGYRGFGHPFGRGNIAFKNGSRVEP